MNTILCPTCRKNDKLEIYQTGEKVVVYCMRCEEGCVPPLIVDHLPVPEPEVKEPPKSDTPRTDAAFTQFNDVLVIENQGISLINFSRDLERENNKFRAALERCAESSAAAGDSRTEEFARTALPKSETL